MTATQDARADAARAAIEAAGVRVVENVQLESAYWLPASRLVVAPPNFPGSGWAKVAAQVLSGLRVPSPRRGE